MQNLRTFRADRGDAGARLDRALMRHLADRPDVSRTRVQELVAAGLVLVNGQPAGKSASRLTLGDRIEVALPPAPPARPAPAAEEILLSILYEDDHLLAVDKPPGMVAHPTFGHRDGTLVNALLWRAREWGPGTRRPGLVHRLDKGTSGVLIVAKTRGAHAGLARAMKARTVEKDYLAVVHGRTTLPKGRIDLKLQRDPEDRRRMAVSTTEGRDSATRWERLAESSQGAPLTLLRCTLVTGRMHQIRAHLAAQGWPIVGDPVYGEPRWKGIGDPDLAALCRDFPRQALHARRLALRHPATGEPLEVVAPVPEDMARLLEFAELVVPS